MAKKKQNWCRGPGLHHAYHGVWFLTSRMTMRRAVAGGLQASEFASSTVQIGTDSTRNIGTARSEIDGRFRVAVY